VAAPARGAYNRLSPKKLRVAPASFILSTRSRVTHFSDRLKPSPDKGASIDEHNGETERKKPDRFQKAG
jgi:hypothetical protein